MHHNLRLEAVSYLTIGLSAGSEKLKNSPIQKHDI